MESNFHKNRCTNGCIRRMDVEQIGKGNFSYYKGTLDCPAQVHKSVYTISLCGCCSYDDGKSTTVETCRLRTGVGDSSECNCHNSMLVYGTCLSKRNHGACPYGLEGSFK